MNFLSIDEFAVQFGTGTLNVNAGGAAAALLVPAPNSWQIYSVRGPVLKLDINGTASATGATSTADIGTPTSSFMYITPGQNVKVAEIILVKGALSDADLAKVQAYLKSKYAL